MDTWQHKIRANLRHPKRQRSEKQLNGERKEGRRPKMNLWPNSDETHTKVELDDAGDGGGDGNKEKDVPLFKKRLLLQSFKRQE